MASEQAQRILAKFHIRGLDQNSWPGVLELQSDATLMLLVVASKLPPELAPFELGARIDLIGFSHECGCVTALGCTLKSTSERLLGGAETFQLELKPWSVWTGPCPFSSAEKFDEIHLGISGIHGVIGTKALERHFLNEDEKELIRPIVGSTYELFYPSDAGPHTFEITKLGATIVFGSQFRTSHSWTVGDKIQTTDFCNVRVPTSLSGDDLIGIGHKVEQFLSFICLKTIRANSLKLVRGQFAEQLAFERVWHLGQRSSAREVMFHEALCTCLKEKAGFGAALSEWMSASEGESVARWLFLDNHFRNEISASRFIGVCQAVELIGRERNSVPPFDKQKFAPAANEAAELLARAVGSDLDPDGNRALIARFRHQILSYNRPSYRDHLMAFTAGIPEAAKRLLLPDEEVFISRILQLRNVFVHMDGRKLAFDEAEKLITGSTYRLLALFAAHEANAIGLDQSVFLNGLSNSSIGRAALYFVRNDAA